MSAAPAAEADRRGDPGLRAGASGQTLAYVLNVMRDVVALLVIVLMFGDIARMLLADR
jgi:hypothetical protein